MTVTARDGQGIGLSQSTFGDPLGLGLGYSVLARSLQYTLVLLGRCFRRHVFRCPPNVPSFSRAPAQCGQLTPLIPTSPFAVERALYYSPAAIADYRFPVSANLPLYASDSRKGGCCRLCKREDVAVGYDKLLSPPTHRIPAGWAFERPRPGGPRADGQPDARD